MSRLRTHPESHPVDRIGWLRVAVLGANDGIVSTASLIVGVAAATAAQYIYTLNKDEERKRHAPHRRSPIADRLIHTVSHYIPHQYD